MPIYEGPKTTYSDTTPQARVISDVIQMIDPRDTPLLSRLGLDGARNKFNLKLNGYKIELLEDELDPLEPAANNGVAIGAADARRQLVGLARREGDGADFGKVVDLSAPYNYTSIFQKAVQVSGTQQVISQYGIDDEFLYQANKAVPHLLRLVERAAFHGVRSAGSAAAPPSMGGLGAFIGDNTRAAGGAIAKADVDSIMEEVFMDGGHPDLLLIN